VSVDHPSPPPSSSPPGVAKPGGSTAAGAAVVVVLLLVVDDELVLVVAGAVVVVVGGRVVVVVRSRVVVVARGRLVVVVGGSVVVVGGAVVVGAAVVLVVVGSVGGGGSWASTGSAERPASTEAAPTAHAPSSPSRAARRWDVLALTKGGTFGSGSPRRRSARDGREPYRHQVPPPGHVSPGERGRSRSCGHRPCVAGGACRRVGTPRHGGAPPGGLRCGSRPGRPARRA